MSQCHLSRLMQLSALRTWMILIALLSTALLCVPYAIAQDNLKTKSNLGIFNGENVKKGEYTFVVALRYKIDQSTLCTGSVVAERWVLTARHCLFEPDQKTPIDLNRIEVWTGRKKGKGKKFAIAEKVLFDEHALEPDVALLRLYDNITSKTVGKVLIRPYEPPSGSTPIVVVGWGFVDNVQQTQATDLQKLDGIVSLDCTTKYTTIVCLRFPAGKGISLGDSGGAALDVRGGVPELFGVASLRVAGGRGGIYVRSNSFYQWVQEQIE